MKKIILLMMVVLGTGVFASSNNGLDRDMRNINIQNQQQGMENLSRGSNTTLEQRTEEEKEDWIFENMTRKKNKNSGR